MHVTRDESRKYYANERTYMQKSVYCMAPFLSNAQKRQIYKNREQTGSCLGLWVGPRIDWLGTGAFFFSFLMMKCTQVQL